MTDQTQSNPVVYVIEPNDITGRAKLVHVLTSMDFRVKHFNSGEEFLREADQCTTGCLVTQLRLNGMSGMEVQTRLKEIGSHLPMIFVSERASTQIIVRSIRDGAISFLDSPVNEDQLWLAVREAFAENTKRLELSLERKYLLTRFSQLSPGESEVLSRLCQGCSNKQIASHLDVSVRTVESRKRRLLNKTSSESIPELLISFQQFKAICQV